MYLPTEQQLIAEVQKEIDKMDEKGVVTMNALGIALLVGSFFITPSMIFDPKFSEEAF